MDTLNDWIKERMADRQLVAMLVRAEIESLVGQVPSLVESYLRRSGADDGFPEAAHAVYSLYTWLTVLRGIRADHDYSDLLVPTEEAPPVSGEAPPAEGGPRGVWDQHGLTADQWKMSIDDLLKGLEMPTPRFYNTLIRGRIRMVGDIYLNWKGGRKPLGIRDFGPIGVALLRNALVQAGLPELKE